MRVALKENKGEQSVLLVEDEEGARICLGRLLGMKFPEVVIYAADNGRMGLDLYRRHMPDLVITDISLPEMNGIELAQAIRAQNPEARLIALSAHSDTDHLVDAAESGVIDYIMKPVDQQKLFAAVGRCLVGRRLDMEADGSDDGGAADDSATGRF